MHLELSFKDMHFLIQSSLSIIYDVCKHYIVFCVLFFIG